MTMFYIYFLYSKCSDKYYVGYSDDPDRRLIEHNTSDNNTFTKKHRPWILVYSFTVSDLRSDALKIEQFIKKQKSRSLIEKIICEKLSFDHFKWVLSK